VLVGGGHCRSCPSGLGNTVAFSYTMLLDSTVIFRSW
jgi:hypothetical protein